MNIKLSIIIPVFRESALISNTIHSLLDLSIPIPFEILISDGELTHSTLIHLQGDKKLNNKPVRLIRAEKGRGPQMNIAARKARGDLLFFLHADTRLDQKGIDLMIKTWQNHGHPFFCGAFDLCINSDKKIFRVIEKTASLRSRLLKIPYGDQGIFMSKKLFENVKGFPDTPIMEDVGIMSRIKKMGVTPIFLAHPIVTSARRWKNQGILYTTLRNWVLISLYILGVSPKVLAKYY
jgi:rSAM/selenodomain-associated transferase 2